jgi:peptidyl-prolyl cis-trans isomerase C
MKARQIPKQEEGKGGEIVAEVGGYEVSAQEIEDYIKDMSAPALLRYETLEGKRQLVEAYSIFLALADEARREGLQNDPGVVEQVKKEMVSRYLMEHVDFKVTPSMFTDEQIQGFYEAHKNLFVRPEQWEVREIVVEERGLADRLVFRLKKKSLDESLDMEKEFLAMLERYSVARKDKDGVIGRFPWVDEGKPDVPEEVRAEAEKMSALFEVRGPILALDGYHVLFATKRFAKVEKTLAEAKPEIVSMLAEKEKEKLRKEFLSQVLKDANVEVYEARVKEVLGGSQ